jgi:hypothetical protein
MAHPLHRPTRLGRRVLINAGWYKIYACFALRCVNSPYCTRRKIAAVLDPRNRSDLRADFLVPFPMKREWYCVLGGNHLAWFDMATTLAEANASTGRTCGHGAVCSALVANIAEPAVVQKVFADPMSSLAWRNLPTAEPREEKAGLRIDGS